MRKTAGSTRVHTDSERLADAIRLLPDPVQIIDRDMTVLYQNDAMVKRAGGQAGMKCYEVMAARDLACADCPAVPAFVDGNTHRSIIKTALPDNRMFTADVAASPIPDGKGEIGACVEVVRDMTGLGDFDFSRSDFFSMITHDLKSPMTVIQGCAGILSDKTSGIGPENRKMVEMIRRCADKTMNLVEDLLAFSKVKAGKMEHRPKPVSLSKFVNTHREDFMLLASEKGVRVEVDIESGIPKALIDEDLSCRVLYNMVTNAIKFSDRGGTVTMRAGISHEDPGRLFLEVIDDGPGIPDVELPMLFDRYYRSAKAGGVKGTGLGLTIVKALSEAQGMDVLVTSREGIGTTLRLTMPAVPSTH